MKKVSVIIPMHNSSKYIEQCLESVIDQTYSNLEIIVIDDASQDNSVEIVKSFCQSKNMHLSKEEKTVNLIELKQNVGAALARNKGIEIASRRLYMLFRFR